MSDTFANEFEKWLERKTSDKDEESTEESDSDSDYVLNTVVKDENDSEKKKYPVQLSNKQGKRISGSMSDQAPILVDDDDDDIDGGNCDDPYHSEKQQFEDEPPILEPAPMHLMDYNMSNLGVPQFSPQNCIRDYSRQLHRRRSSLQKEHTTMKTYSNKDKVNHFSEICNQSLISNSLKSKDLRGSGNIFDKFNSNSYEQFPPPLIPSPEALRLQSESPKSEYKHSSHSPNFCAMEADSTSEIGDKASRLFNYRRPSKKFVHCDIAFECDSTCMLAASPLIVSPSSVSHGETEERRDPGGGNKSDDMFSSDSSLQKFDDHHFADAENDQQPSTITEPTKLVCNITSAVTLRSECFNRDTALQTMEEQKSHYCPQLFVASTSNTVCKLFSSNVSNETKSNNIIGFPNEPPILSIISPQLRSHPSRRRKRHTVDSPDNYLRSEKVPHTMSYQQADTESADFDTSSPPRLTHASETFIAFSSEDDCSNVVSQRSKNCHQNKKPHSRRKKRFNTFPSSNLTVSSHMSEDLHNLVIRTSQLSQLQTHMHMLLYQLFPQLRTKLDSMSPESNGFEVLLSDIVMSLEQPCAQITVQDYLSSSPFIPAKDMKHSSVCKRPVSNIPQLGCTSRSTSGKLSSSSLPSLQDCQAADIVKQNYNSDECCSPTSPTAGPSNASSHYDRQHCHFLRQQKAFHCRDSDLVIPQLSRMTLQDVGELIRPLKIVLYKDPGALLETFSELSCKALQLLLPDLNISLCNELAGSPQDLITFIHNVIGANSRRRSKH